MFLDQNNYMLNKLSRKAGARVVVHDPSNPPLADEYGLDLRPNTASSIAIQIVSISNLSLTFSFVIHFKNFLRLKLQGKQNLIHQIVPVFGTILVIQLMNL